MNTTIRQNMTKLLGLVMLISLLVTSVLPITSVQALNQTPIKKSAYYWKNFTLTNFQDRLSKSRDQGITVLYVNIEFFLNPWLDQRKSFAQLSSMITMAHSYGVSIHAMMGNTTWSDPFTDEIIYRAFNFIKKYNAENTLSLIDGYHLNIEFYNKYNYNDARVYNTQNFIKFTDNIASEVKKYQTVVPNFSLSTTIPHFADYDRYIPSVEYEGVKTTLFEHVARTFHLLPNSNLVIMAYRSHGVGDDTITDIVKSEFDIAKSRFKNLKIVLAIETIDIGDSNVSFYGNSRRDIDRELVKVHHELQNVGAYNGIAIHVLDTYVDLRD
jgi:hypothetical protein